MTRFLFALAFVAFAVWTVLGLIAWGIVSLGGDLLRAASPWLFFGHPDGAAIAETASRIVTAMGGSVVAFVWLAGSMVLLAGTLLLRALGTSEVRMARFEFRHGSRPGDRRWESRPLKDVTPPRQPDHQHPRLRPPDPRHPE